MTTSLSIIIPTKNEERLLPGCLDSLKKQDTQSSWELLIIDSSDSDKTAQIAIKYGARVIKEERLGKGLALSTGANEAKGQILCFTEADCILPPNWLSVIESEFNRNPDLVALTSDYSFHDSSWTYNFILKFFLPISIWGYYILYNNHSLRGTNFAVKASAYHKCGGVSQTAKEFQDVELGLRLREVGKIRFVRAMRNKTSDRRIRGRLLVYIKEFVPTIWNLLVLRKIQEESTYEDIR